jgi:mRNA interferase MazF
VLLLTRNEVIDQLSDIIAVPATRTIRGLRTEVILTPEEGMAALCALNFDHIGLARANQLGPLITMFPDDRWPEIRTALLAACGFDVDD